MRVRYSKRFNKRLVKAPLEVRKAFLIRRKLFLKNRDHPKLREHKLSGKYKGCSSINVTGDWRAVFLEEKIDGEVVVNFVALGTHSQLYG